jgi:hypothetical protein
MHNKKANSIHPAIMSNGATCVNLEVRSVEIRGKGASQRQTLLPSRRFRSLRYLTFGNTHCGVSIGAVGRDQITLLLHKEYPSNRNPRPVCSTIEKGLVIHGICG